VIWSAVLLGALGAGATAMQRDAGIPAGAAAATEAALIVAVLAAQAVMARRARRRRG
jgi:simple sugar transport system permease protein